MLLNPRAEILNLCLCLLYCRGVKAGIEHVVNRMTIDCLLVLRANFENAATQRRFHERQRRVLRHLIGRGFDLFRRRLANDAGQLLRGFDLRIRIAGLE